ncbi:MAG: hypothetical protein ACTSRF_05005 [Candidatus Freyarchaeota archaeon]
MDRVWDADRVVALIDHWTPAGTVDEAIIHQKCREFVEKYRIKNWLGMREGICHRSLQHRNRLNGHGCGSRHRRVVVQGSSHHEV